MKEKWINIGKSLAIFGVMVDHLSMILYTNRELQLGSLYSVSLFVLIMGVTTYWSYESSGVKLGIKVAKRVRGILIPYIIAIFMYMIIAFHSFDMDTALSYFLHFNVSMQLYYVLLYIQMLLISPLVYRGIKKIQLKKFLLNRACIVILGGGLLVIAIWLSDNTNIFSVYGGGGKLLGGTYLFLLYIGMLVGASYEKMKHFKLITKVILMIAGGCGICLWLRFICVDAFGIDQKLLLKSYLNPPGASLMIYAILVLFTVMFAVDLLEGSKNKVIDVILKPFDYMGRHTLYIFLYHRWWLDYVIPYIPEKIRFYNMFISWFLYMGIMILGSLIIEVVMIRALDFAKESYSL